MTQNAQIIGLDGWLQTPTGQYLLAWEQAHFDRSVCDLFGFHALQVGLPQLETLACNRMPHRWVALDQAHLGAQPALQPARSSNPAPATPPVARAGTLTAGQPPNGGEAQAMVPRAVFTEFDALPFETQSLDLVVLPHTLELSRDPHQTLREVERVLVPEGKVVVTGLNPASLWAMQRRSSGMCRRMGQALSGLPPSGDLIGYWRLRDWLRLLSFDIEGGRFGCYRPVTRSEQWLERFGWMDRSGERWWPVLGGVYFLVATKRVRGMRVIGPAWKQKQQAKAAQAVAASRKDSWRKDNGGHSA